MKLELCAASTEAIDLAKELNFDRIELCQSLENGGLTPSFSLVDYALRSGVETHVLIRPRGSSFCYSAAEGELMVKDIEELKKLGVSGVVVGCLTANRTIDEKSLVKLLKAAEGLEVTFHRAFDDISGVQDALDLLIELGVKRVLSSGQSSTITAGMQTLRGMLEHAEGRIEIMAGGGVTAGNCSQIKDTVNPDAIHFSGTIKENDSIPSAHSEPLLVINREKVQGIMQALAT